MSYFIFNDHAAVSLELFSHSMIFEIDGLLYYTSYNDDDYTNFIPWDS